jgi:hypothetical protein
MPGEGRGFRQKLSLTSRVTPPVSILIFIPVGRIVIRVRDFSDGIVRFTATIGVISLSLRVGSILPLVVIHVFPAIRYVLPHRRPPWPEIAIQYNPGVKQSVFALYVDARNRHSASAALPYQRNPRSAANVLSSLPLVV